MDVDFLSTIHVASLLRQSYAIGAILPTTPRRHERALTRKIVWSDFHCNKVEFVVVGVPSRYQRFICIHLQHGREEQNCRWMVTYVMEPAAIFVLLCTLIERSVVVRRVELTVRAQCVTYGPNKPVDLR